MQDFSISFDSEGYLRLDQGSDSPRSSTFSPGTAQHRLALGPAHLAKRFFNHELPTEGEVEEAINYIEDELMRHLDLVRAGERFRTTEALFVEILGLGTFSRQEVEELFTRYALRSMGRSAVYDDLTIEAKAYAALLVLRELLHHYDFHEVRVESGSAL